MFNKILNFFLSYSLVLLLSVIEIQAYSQNTKSIKTELLESGNNSNIKVSKLKKTSLGSLGITTDANKLMGLDIWTNMEASVII